MTSYSRHFPGVISLDVFPHHVREGEPCRHLDPGCLYDFLAIYPRAVATGVFYACGGVFRIIVWYES